MSPGRGQHRRAQIAAHGIANPVEVLLVHRPIEAELRAKLRQPFGRGADAELPSIALATSPGSKRIVTKTTTLTPKTMGISRPSRFRKYFSMSACRRARLGRLPHDGQDHP